MYSSPQQHTTPPRTSLAHLCAGIQEGENGMKVLRTEFGDYVFREVEVLALVHGHSFRLNL